MRIIVVRTLFCTTSLSWQVTFQLEGSVDEESTKSDEEYDDLAMQDFPDGDYMSDDDANFFRAQLNAMLSVSGGGSTNNGNSGDKYQQNLDLFLKKDREPLSKSLMCSFPSFVKDRSAKGARPSGICKLRRRSLSIPAFGKHGSLIDVPIQ